MTAARPPRLVAAIAAAVLGIAVATRWLGVPLSGSGAEAIPLLALLELLTTQSESPGTGC